MCAYCAERSVPIQRPPVKLSPLELTCLCVHLFFSKHFCSYHVSAPCQILPQTVSVLKELSEGQQREQATGAGPI